MWDDPEQRARMLHQLHEALDPLDIHLRLHRYPLNPDLFDLAYKYNHLMAQAYADGCDYLYQYSDDAYMVTPGALSNDAANPLLFQKVTAVDVFCGQIGRACTRRLCARMAILVPSVLETTATSSPCS